MHRHPLVTAFLVSLAAIWLVERLRASGLVAGACAVVALGCLLGALRRRRGVAIVSWIAMGAVAGWARASAAPPRAPPTCATASGIKGYAASTWVGRVDGPLESRRAGARTVLALERERCGDTWVGRRGRVAVTLWQGPDVVRGDEVELTLAVEPIGEAHNPTEPDALIQGGIDGVDAVARVLSVHRVVGSRRHGFALIDRARRAAAASLSSRLSAEHAAVARGLVMGDRGGLGAADREAWADAGLAHLLAVSGMHVTMVVVAIGAAVRFVVGRVPGLVERWPLLGLAAVVALPGALVFCAWSASPASAVRATLMGSVALVGAILGRPTRAVEALGFTGLAMVIEQPLVLHDAGFALSMAAVASLLASPRLRVDEAAQLAHRPMRLVRAARRMLLLGLVASVAATLAALPITAAFFGRVSLVAPLTNLAAVPIGATLATPLALVVVCVAPVAPQCADWLAVPLDALLRWLVAIVHVGEKLPGATVAVGAPRAHELFFYGVVLTTGFAALRFPRRRRTLALVCLTGGFGLAASAIVRWRDGRSADHLVITLPYVGQGDGIIVQFPSGQTAVVDAGGAITTSDWDPGRQVIAPLLRRMGKTTIDLAVVSHPHPDHIGGFAYLGERFVIAELWTSGQRDEAGHLVRLEESVMRRGGCLRRSGALAATVAYGGVLIDVIHPRAEDTSYFPELGANDNSLVLRLRHGGRSMLLTGDIEAIAEHEIVASGNDIAADILKVAHHGSRTSSTDELLDAVQPRLAVASCGVHNQFGFPHREVLERFRVREVPFLTTAEHGALTLRTDGVTWQVSAHRRDLRLPEAPTLEGVPDDD